MDLQGILLKKLEYQIFAWKKEIEKIKAGPEKKKAGIARDTELDRAGTEIDENEYIRRVERNIEAAVKKMEEVRNADENRLLYLKKQISDWMDYQNVS